MKLLGISGSLRRDSHNSALVREAERAFAPSAFTFADIRFPLFDEDLEAEGIPEAVTAFHSALETADAIVISTPEYNKGLSGVLKNALDWSSRVKPMPMRDKPVAIMSATAGRAGGERTQMTLRHCLLAFRPRLLTGPELMVAGADKAFDNGRLVDPKALDVLQALMAELRRAAGG